MKQLFFLLLALAYAPIAYAQTETEANEYKMTFDTETKTKNKIIKGSSFYVLGNLLGEYSTGDTYTFSVNTSDGSKVIYEIYTNQGFEKIIQSNRYEFGVIEAGQGINLTSLGTYYIVTVEIPHKCIINSLLEKNMLMQDKDVVIFSFDNQEDAQKLVDFLKK